MTSATPEYCKLCGDKLGANRVVIAGRLYHQGCIPDTGGWKNAGIEAAYNCLLREAIVDIERNSEPEVRAQFEKFRPALDAMCKSWPWLRGEGGGLDGT